MGFTNLAGINNDNADGIITANWLRTLKAHRCCPADTQSQQAWVARCGPWWITAKGEFAAEKSTDKK